MTIKTGIGRKFLEELPLGIHTLSEGTPDTVKLALYGPNANISPLLDSYVTTGEIAGSGYTAGGVAVPLTIVGATGSSRNGGTQFSFPYAQPTDDTTVLVTGVGIRGCMLYNASQNNRNIFTLDFGSTFSPSVGLVIQWGLSGVNDENKTLIPLIGRFI